MAAQRHPCPSDGGAGAARVGAGGSFGHVTASRAMPKASPPYASDHVRAHGGEAAEDMSSRQRTILFAGDASDTSARPTAPQTSTRSAQSDSVPSPPPIAVAASTSLG